MTQYLIDSVSLNSIHKEFIKNKSRNDCRFTEEIVFELDGMSNSKIMNFISKRIYPISGEVLEALPVIWEALFQSGIKLRIIDLYSNKGNGDLVNLAVAYYETQQNSNKLLPEDWIIVTDDKNLRKAARLISVESISAKEFLSRTAE